MSSFPSHIPRYIINQNKVGDVYIVVFKDDVPIRKMAHHALIIDVTGTTIGSHPHGVLLHFTASATTCETEFQFDDHLYQPRKWALALQEFGHDICDELIDEQGHNLWSSKLNCQVFVKILLERFGFKRLSELPFIDDSMIPVIIDLSIGFISFKAIKFHETAKILSYTPNIRGADTCDDDSS